MLLLKFVFPRLLWLIFKFLGGDVAWPPPLLWRGVGGLACGGGGEAHRGSDREAHRGRLHGDDLQVVFRWMLRHQWLRISMKTTWLPGESVCDERVRSGVETWTRWLYRDCRFEKSPPRHGEWQLKLNLKTPLFQNFSCEYLSQRKLLKHIFEIHLPFQALRGDESSATLTTTTPLLPCFRHCALQGIVYREENEVHTAASAMNMSQWVDMMQHNARICSLLLYFFR